MTCWFYSFIMLNWWTKRFFPEPKKNLKSRIWNIKQVKIDLGSFACKHILFLPAMLGCDTTSWLYGVGKGTILKKFKTNFELQKATEAFDTILSTSSQIVSAGESVLVIMYGCKTNESLKTLCWRKYCEKLATSLAHIDPKGLPPTSAASKYHSYRVYYQICQWKSSECDMLPESWRWTIMDSGLYPTKTNLPPATSTSASATSLACGQCHGTACINVGAFVADDEEPCDEEPCDEVLTLEYISRFSHDAGFVKRLSR